MSLTEYRHLFPITEEYAYLNHASVAPYSVPVVRAMDDFIARRHRRGWLDAEMWLDRLEEIRGLIAQLIAADAEEITFTISTSHGLNIVASGIDWREGDNLIGAETEFPANVYPWLNLRRLGIEVRFAPARDNRILVEDIATLIDERTRLVALSFVEFATGFRNDLKAIGQLCRERGIYFCVDGIQGLGALDLKVTQVPIDFLSTGGPKWLMGPIGAGFLYCRQALIERLIPIRVGWWGVVDRDDFFCYDSPLRDDARRFEEGSPNLLGIHGLGASLELLLEIGIPQIEERVLGLTNHLIAGLQERGYHITTPIASPQERSGIVCFNHPHHALDNLEQRLKKARVIISKRGQVIRVSPHFYNDETDIDQLLDALP
jgi:cysteine desulfurase/selenocysteine lyase